MSFQLTTENQTLDVSTGTPLLTGKCLDTRGRRSYSSISLDSFLGNDNGKFSWNMIGFSKDAQDILLDGVFLYASLKATDGSWHPRRIDLSLCIANIKGKLMFHDPTASIVESCRDLMIDDDGVLRASCLGSDGEYHPSSIALDEHIGNQNGSFIPGARHFVAQAMGIHLVGFKLRCSLLRNNGSRVHSTLNLTGYLNNSNGTLTFNARNGWFGRDGPIVMALEGIPVLGYFVALFDCQIPGDTDRALRAVAECTGRTIVHGATALGASAGGPVGASLGAACATLLALVVRPFITNRIQDDSMRREANAALTPWQAVKKYAVPVLLPLVRTFEVGRVVAGWCGAVLNGGIAMMRYEKLKDL